MGVKFDKHSEGNKQGKVLRTEKDLNDMLPGRDPQPISVPISFIKHEKGTLKVITKFKYEFPSEEKIWLFGLYFTKDEAKKVIDEFVDLRKKEDYSKKVHMEGFAVKESGMDENGYFDPQHPYRILIDNTKLRLVEDEREKVRQQSLRYS